AVPGPLVAATAKLVAGAVPVEIVALAEGVLKLMLLKKLKVGLVVLMLGVLVCGVGGPLSAQAPTTTDPTAPVTEKGPAPEPDKDASAFIGTWTNVVKNSRLLRRVAIEKKGDNWTVQTWPVAGGKEVAGKKTNFVLLLNTLDRSAKFADERGG